MRRLIEWWIAHHHEHHHEPQSPTDGVRAEHETMKRELAQMSRDLSQVKKINTYLLDKAEAKGRLSPPEAAALRATQTYEHEDLGIGPDC